MKTTQNLKLPQYTGEDIFDLQDVNKAYNSIDKAYKEVIDIKDEISKANATAEVINARGGKETLGKRLDEFDSQLDTVDNEVVRLKDFLENSNSGNVSQEDIKAAVNDYFEENPVQSGATTEQVAQIEANKTAIGDESSGLIKEVNDIKNTELQNLNTAILRVNETVGNKSELPVGDENIIASINRIDNKQFDSVTDEQVSTAVNDYLEKNPVQSGATTEQANQIEANRTAITNAKIYNANASVPLNLPSYDDALNQATHPKVLYFPDKWNGYKFWCAFTPYCYGQMIHENPCICASNDGLNWIVPQGLKNPIDYPENIDDYFSDTHLVFKDNTLECWYRKVLVDSTGVINKGEVICRKTSTNGVIWSDAEEMYRIDGGASSLLSPIIIWDEDNSLYQIWICAGGSIKYYETPTGKDWSFVRSINIPCWHADIIKSDKGYELVGYVINPNKLSYYTSKDNINWSTEKIIMFPKPGSWDSGLYRSSLVIVNDKYYLYYSGTGSDTLRTTSAWRVGLSISKDLNIETLEGIKSDYSMNKINVLENYHKTYFGTTEERKKFKPSDSYLYPYKYFDTTLLKELYYYKSKWYDCNANVVAFTDTAPTISTDILDININSGDRAVIPFKAVDDNDIYEFRYYLNIENPDGKNNGISFNPILNFKNEQHLILKGLSDGNYTCVIGARSTYNGNVSWVYSNKFNINVGIPGLNYGSIVLSTSTLDINEGLSNNFTIKLDKAPTESQSVNLTVNNNYCTLDKNSLTFTSSNYNIPQTITVSAIADSSSYSDKSSIITCSSSGTSSKTINVNIKNTDIAPTVAVESVSLDKNSHSLSLNKTVQLNATVLPENATNKNVTWASNNENCTVINGLVSAKAIGESIITCTTEDGNKTDTCTITVVENTSNGVLRDSSLYLEINDESISSAHLDRSINKKGTVVLPDQTSNGHDLKLPNTNGAPSYDALSNIICDGKWYSKEISSSLEEYGFQNVDVTFSEGLTLEFRFESTRDGAEALAILRGENTYNGRTLLNIRRMSDNHLNITGNGINLDLTDVIIPNSAHVAVTLSSNGCNVYIDGVNVYTNSVAYESALFSTTVRRIDHSSNNNSRIVGYNLYRVYTKVLNAEEIQGNYSASILS